MHRMVRIWYLPDGDVHVTYYPDNGDPDVANAKLLAEHEIYTRSTWSDVSLEHLPDLLPDRATRNSWTHDNSRVRVKNDG